MKKETVGAFNSMKKSDGVDSVIISTPNGDSVTFDRNKSGDLGIDLFMKLELGADAEDVFEIPSGVLNDECAFEKDDGELRRYFDALMYEYGETTFEHLKEAEIHFLWKAKGGKSGGREVWGKCKKPSGELAHYSNADYIILLSADHCFEHRLKNWQILALLYHELKHTGVDENGAFVTVGHEFEGFNDELRLFGAWHSSAEAIVNTAQKLPGFE